MNSYERLSARALLERAEVQARERMRNGQPVQLSPAPIVNAAKDEAVVYVLDPIGGWFGLDPTEWIRALDGIKARVIHMRVNSPGGSVLDAEAMRVAVRRHPARVIAHIDGLAASAATGLTLAADEIEMSAGAMYMIHNPWGVCAGGEEDMHKYAGLLAKTRVNLVAAYDRKTRQGTKRISQWMDQETWFTAAEALEHGFVDRIFIPDTDAGQGLNSRAAREKRSRALALAKLSL